MTEGNVLSSLLLAELESELATTRRMLAAVPEGSPAFKCHDKSMTLGKLAGHVAEMPAFTAMLLTTPGLDVGAPGGPPPFVHETSAATLAAYDSFAAMLVDALKSTTDESFHADYTLTYGAYVIFQGSRYNCYRSLGLNHLVHHRAQLGVYLRLLDIPVPKTYGPSADEM